MKTKRSLILLFAFSLLSLSAFKGKKSNALVLNANHSWKTEVSYDKAANIAGYILHNDKLTEIVIINMDDLGFAKLVKQVNSIGHPVNRITIQQNALAFTESNIHLLKKKFPGASIFISSEKAI